MVFFGPVTWRAPTLSREGGGPPRFPAWRLVSLQDQWARFTADVPPSETPVLSRERFAQWGERYLDSDPESRTRSPESVKTPSGPWQDIADAWAGRLAYDPGRIRAPVAIIRGEWDSIVGDADARWLFDALTAAPLRRDVKIARATHLMHLEDHRHALYREVETFLAGGDLGTP
jgi:pimeloyl-ACP methyl ester carboxylesterase